MSCAQSCTLIKCSKLSIASTVYRGTTNANLPEQFIIPNEFNLRGGVECGFTNTTVDQDKAVH